MTIYRKVRIEGWIQDRNTADMELSEIAREMEQGGGICTLFDPAVQTVTREQVILTTGVMEEAAAEFFGIEV